MKITFFPSPLNQSSFTGQVASGSIIFAADTNQEETKGAWEWGAADEGAGHRASSARCSVRFLSVPNSTPQTGRR